MIRWTTALVKSDKKRKFTRIHYPMFKLVLPLIFSLLALCVQSQNLYLKNHNTSNSNNKVCVVAEGNKKAILAFAKKHGGVYKYSLKKNHHLTLSEHDLTALSKLQGVKRVEFYHHVPVLLNDSMRVKARVNQVHQGLAPLPQGYTGKGIIVGFIDDGIDFNHPDFLDSAGNTRVLAIWDQSQPFDALRTPPHYGYGQIWDSTDINNGICTSEDLSGHGTTVAGTAAGNGRSTGTHQGAAPDAWIVMVKTNESVPNWTLTVADAVDYMYKLADSLNMPCVINASVGDYYGSHDGRDFAAQYIDSLIKAKRGRLMVAALGNSGTLPPYHLETYVDSDTNFTWFNYNAPGGGDAFPYGVVYFEVFADSAEFNDVYFSMGADQATPTFKHRGQAPFRKITDFIGTTITDTIFSPEGNILGIVDYYAEYQGDLAFMQVHMMEPDSNAYKFRFSTTGSGRFDVWTGEWLGISNMVNTGLPSAAVFPDIVHYVSPDSAKTMVSSFQCLESVITVANYNNIQTYLAYDGSTVNLGEPEGAIASTSSRGPTRDNRQKPDVAATGNVTFSPGPLNILADLIAVAPHKLLPDGMHMRNGGTSMASPVVAGIGALMLERCPNLRWDEFKQHINSTAYNDSFTGVTPNISFGYGKVNAYDAILETVYVPQLTGDSVICADSYAAIVAPAGFTQYIWSTGDSLFNVSSDSSTSVWFTGIDAAGCKTDTAYWSVSVNPLPVISITTNADTLAGITATGNAYQWYYNGAPIGGGNDSIYIASTSGLYFVTASDANGCTGTSDTIYFSPAGLNTITTSNGISLYPNPLNGNYLNITSRERIETVEVFSVDGKRLMVVNGLQSTNLNLNLAAIANGIYHLRISSATTRETLPLIKN